MRRRAMYLHPKHTTATSAGPCPFQVAEECGRDAMQIGYCVTEPLRTLPMFVVLIENHLGIGDPL